MVGGLGPAPANRRSDRLAGATAFRRGATAGPGEAIPSPAEARGLWHEVRRLRGRLAATEAELGRDPLTGLANRRRLAAVLPALVEAHHADGRPLSVAVVDVDRFKAINDGHGHATGDDALKLVAAVLSSRRDAVRLTARLGGDEFVLVLPGAALDAAERTVEDLRRRLARRRLVARGSRRAVGAVGISAGVAELRRGERADDLLRRADAALYAAKRAGRSAVAAAGGPWAPPEAGPRRSARPPGKRLAALALVLLGGAAVVALRTGPDHRAPAGGDPAPVAAVADPRPAEVAATAARGTRVCVYRAGAEPSCAVFD